MTIVVVIEAVAIVLLGLLVAGLLRSHAEILRELHALGRGREETASRSSPVELRPSSDTTRPAFDVAGQTPGGEAVAVAVAGTAHDTLLAFLSSGCLTCADFWEALGGGRDAKLPAGTRVVAVAKGPGEESASALEALAPPGVAVVMSTQAWLDYEVPGSPYFVHVDGAGGRIRGEGTAATWDQVTDLIRRASEERLRQPERDLEAQIEAKREARIDQELMAAGIGPGDPQLYPSAPPVSGDEQ